MKLFKMILDHTNDEIGNEFYVVCNSMTTVVDYETKSIVLITDDVIVRKDD